MFRKSKVRNAFAALAIAFAVAPPSIVEASTLVKEGFDLLATWPGSTFNFNGQQIALKGKPSGISNGSCGAGEFDFGLHGGPSGCQNIGSTSAIIKRDEAQVANVGDTASINIEFIALSLTSVNPLPGLGNIDVLLTRDRGSPADIEFKGMDGGVFDTVLKFSIEVFDSVGNLILADGGLNDDNEPYNIELFQNPSAWGRTRPQQLVQPGIPQLPGINFQLNGQNTDDDFWSATGPYVSMIPLSSNCPPGQAQVPTEHLDPTPAHVHCTASTPPIIPVPATFPMLAGGLVVLGGLLKFRRRLAK